MLENLQALKIIFYKNQIICQDHINVMQIHILKTWKEIYNWDLNQWPHDNHENQDFHPKYQFRHVCFWSVTLRAKTVQYIWII